LVEGRIEQMDRPGMKFDLLVNMAGEYMIVFPATPQKVENPVFQYDGEGTVYIYKNKEARPLILKPFTDEAKEGFLKIKTILCVEAREEEIINEFEAKVVVKKIK